MNKYKEDLKIKDEDIHQKWAQEDFNVDHRFDVSLITDNKQYSAKLALVHIAAFNDHSEIVKALLEKGANVNAQDKSNKTAFHGRADIVKYLVEQGIDPLIKNEYNKTPIGLAQHKNTVQFLKEIKAKQIINKTTKARVILGIITMLTVGVGCSSTGVKLSIFNDHLDKVEYLIDGSDQKDNDGFTALHRAVFNGHLDVVKYFVDDKKVSPDQKDNAGNTALHIAASYGHLGTVKYLIEKGADPLMKNKNGKTPRELAKNKDTVRFLKKAETLNK